MKQTFPISLVLFCVLAPFLGAVDDRVAYTLESRELSRRPHIQEIYSDTVVRTLDGVWDLDTDTQLAQINDGGDYGTFLDFDLTTRRSLYRQKRYDSSRGKYFFVVEARNQVGQLLFSKEDSVSHEPEAFFVAGGLYILKRTNDPDTLELALELYRIESGELVWRHTPGGSPRWRLSSDSLSFIELVSERTENKFHTAMAYDTLSKAEVDRDDLRGLNITRGSNYLSRLKLPVGVFTGQTGTMIFNERSVTLSPIENVRASIPGWADSPTIDAEVHYAILHVTTSVFSGPVWHVVDSRTGEFVANSQDLGLTSLPLGLRSNPAISANGQFVYHLVDYGKIEVWNPHTKSKVRQLSYSNIPLETLVPSPDDRHLLALALKPASDDFMVLIDTETNLPLYSKLKRDPVAYIPPDGGFGYVVAFTRHLELPPSGNRFYFTTVQGFEAFDFKTGEKIEDGAAFAGKVITSRYVAPEQAWVTVYETGRVRIEKDDSSIATEWIHLANTTGVLSAAIDSQSGSVAIQQDNSYYITHPFDEREDQWIGNLSFGNYPISLHHGGKWLAADYRGIYDLETDGWLPLESNMYSHYAINETDKDWAQYDPKRSAIVVQNFANDSIIEIPRDEQFSSISGLAFSNDGLQLYALVYATIDNYNGQSLFVYDIGPKSIVQRFPLYEENGATPFSKMTTHPAENRVLLSRRKGNSRSVDLNTGEVSLPTFLEPIYTADWDNGTFDLSVPTLDGSFRFADEYGHLYHLRETTAHLVASNLLPSKTSSSQLLFEERPNRTYWILSTTNLADWSTEPDTSVVADWFLNHGSGYFRVYESEVFE